MRFSSITTGILFTTILFSQTWEIQDSGVNNKLNDVYFIDEYHGWAIGENSTIIATTDGGNNWQVQSSPTDSIVFEHLQFVNESVGYIVGYKDYPYNHGIILSTNNGGNTWAISKIDTNFEYLDLSFVNPDTGWVVGSDFFDTRQGVILQTVDGGQSWAILLKTDSSSIFLGTMTTAIEFIDENVGWIFAGYFYDNFDHTYVYKTADAGATWNMVGEVLSVSDEIDISPPDTMWCGGWIGFGISTNGGVDWTRIHDPDIVTNQDVELLNGHTGWYIGATFTGSKIRYTEDVGLSWTEILTDQIPWLNSIYAFATDLIWVVGDSGIVMHYSPNSASVDADIENIPKSIILIQNHPNPFNPITRIQYDLPHRSDVQITIYDLLGRKVTTLVSEKQDAGKKTVTWNATNDHGKPVSAGVYLYQIRAGEYVQTRKMVLLK